MTATVEDRPSSSAAVHGGGRLVDAIGSPVDLWLADAAGVWQPMDLCRVLSVDLHTGRGNPSSPVAEPAALIADVIDNEGAVSRSAVLHRPVAVMVSPAAVTYWGLTRQPCLFLGAIAEVVVRSDPRLGTVLTITASSHLADLGRTYVGDVPWPAERATVRASRVMSLAGYGVSLYAGYFDPSVLARDVDRQPALDLVAALALEALFAVTDYTGNLATWGTLPPTVTWASVPAAVTWQAVNNWTPPGVPGVPPAVVPGPPPSDPQALLVASTWREAYAAARAAGPPGELADLTITACELLADWSATYTYAGMVNRLTMRYGPTPTGAEQPEAIYTDAASVTAYGPLESSLTTDLATKADADAMAGHLFATSTVVRPALPALAFDLWHTADKTTGTAFLMTGDRPVAAWWWVPDLPGLLPVNRYGYLWLEGLHQTITPDGWAVQATVSDPWAYGNAWQWIQLPAAQTWAAMPPTVTWADVNAWVEP